MHDWDLAADSESSILLVGSSVNSHHAVFLSHLSKSTGCVIILSAGTATFVCVCTVGLCVLVCVCNRQWTVILSKQFQLWSQGSVSVDQPSAIPQLWLSFLSPPPFPQPTITSLTSQTQWWTSAPVNSHTVHFVIIELIHHMLCTTKNTTVCVTDV